MTEEEFETEKETLEKDHRNWRLKSWGTTVGFILLGITGLILYTL